MGLCPDSRGRLLHQTLLHTVGAAAEEERDAIPQTSVVSKRLEEGGARSHDGFIKFIVLIFLLFTVISVSVYMTLHVLEQQVKISMSATPGVAHFLYSGPALKRPIKQHQTQTQWR